MVVVHDSMSAVNSQFHISRNDRGLVVRNRGTIVQPPQPSATSLPLKLVSDVFAIISSFIHFFQKKFKKISCLDYISILCKCCINFNGLVSKQFHYNFAKQRCNAKDICSYNDMNSKSLIACIQSVHTAPLIAHVKYVIKQY